MQFKYKFIKFNKCDKVSFIQILLEQEIKKYVKFISNKLNDYEKRYNSFSLFGCWSWLKSWFVNESVGINECI